MALVSPQILGAGEPFITNNFTLPSATAATGTPPPAANGNVRGGASQQTDVGSAGFTPDAGQLLQRLIDQGLGGGTSRGSAGDLGTGSQFGGQPGSAGDPSLGKSVADGLMGAVMGLGPLGLAGALMGHVGGFASNSPSLLGALLGGGFTSGFNSPSQSTIENMGINPSAYGLDNAAVSRTGQMTQDEATAAKQAAADAAAAGGEGGGASPGGGTSGTAGGEHGAEKGAATGTDASGLGGGGTGAGTGSGGGGNAGGGGFGGGGPGAGVGQAKGGRVKGPGFTPEQLARMKALGFTQTTPDPGPRYGESLRGPALDRELNYLEIEKGYTDKRAEGAKAAAPAHSKGGHIHGPAVTDANRDNVVISAQTDEHVMNRAAVRLIGRAKLDRINKLALSGNPRDREKAKKLLAA